MRLAFALGSLSLVLGACHAPADQNNIDGSMGSGSGSGDAAVAADFTTLISRSWTVDPGTQTYKCVRIQVPTDTWITAFRSLAPLGTHHSVLTISTNSTQLGEYDCTAESLDPEMLYAAGVSTDDNYFPTGVAIHVPAGTYINLNLHLFNTTDNPITDTSGVLVKTMAQADVQNEADMQFSGTLNFDVPANAPGDTTTVTPISGGCAIAHDVHVFTLWPHMHQIAVHQTFTVTGPSWGASGTKLLDADYSFGNQKNYPMTDTVLHAGDHINTTCDYINTTGADVPFGESSTDEMCFTGIYRYPVGGNLLACAYGQAI